MISLNIFLQEELLNEVEDYRYEKRIYIIRLESRKGS